MSQRSDRYEILYDGLSIDSMYGVFWIDWPERDVTLYGGIIAHGASRQKINSV